MSSRATPIFIVERRGEALVVERVADASSVGNIVAIVIAGAGQPAELAREAAIEHFSRNPERMRVLVYAMCDEAW
jgi:hypothetical protein